MNLPVLVINRAEDRERWMGFCAAAARVGVEPHRIDARDGHVNGFLTKEDAALVGSTFWGRSSIKPGALACFISHRTAWRAVLDSGYDAALICEDDARLTEDTSRVSEILAGVQPINLLFANDRMAAWATAAGGNAEIKVVSDVLSDLGNASGPAALGLKRAPGGDAYVLSRRGAKRLLDATARQKILCGVDWAMIWNSLEPVKVPVGFPELEILKEIAPESADLTAHVLTRPIAMLAENTPSVLRHSIEIPIADLLSG
ncbi:MAG: glycosyltransferase family 25 protein [Pseudomonadota bacterium]